MINKEIEKIKRMANPTWLKYISCKKCGMNYDIDIATEPCVRCGGYEFEQFDLILYHMIETGSAKSIFHVHSITTPLHPLKWGDEYNDKTSRSPIAV